ncbi:MAG TPA: hypothetical protein VLJ59_11315 [Mycobacteriales bacterium]|nr:hypothetical protein [Mycobacteriales bacterium]
MPAYSGAEPLAAVATGAMSRCGVCKWVFPRGPRLALVARQPCPDCGVTVRSPADAAVLACAACDSWSVHPELGPSTRVRVDEILREQHRIADLVDRLMGTPGPDQVTDLSPGKRRLTVTKPVPEAFAEAFVRAVREATAPRQRCVLELRYGLDGRPGRTFREIGLAVHRSPSQARAILDQSVRAIVSVARETPGRLQWQQHPCAVTVHLAIQALGDLETSLAVVRIRDFVDRALPHAGPDAGTDLLLRLSGWRDALAPNGHDRLLRRTVAAVRSDVGH